MGAFQDAFVAALAGEAAALAPWLDAAEAERLCVYRNTVAKGCADAIRVQFPTVEAVVGQAWLGEAALVFARDHPPGAPSLADYGADFPDWLSGFSPAADLPFLGGLARIDRARTEALFARDAPAVSAEEISGLPTSAYGAVRLELHPAARLLIFDAAVPALWAALQMGPSEATFGHEPQAMLILRPGLEVGWRVLRPGAGAFLASCQQGMSLADAGAQALSIEPDLELGPVFADLIGAGAFGRLVYPEGRSGRISSAS